jgi:hypothetical protein
MSRADTRRGVLLFIVLEFQTKEILKYWQNGLAVAFGEFVV